MKNDYTHITVLLDSSGSMLDIKKDTIGGFNGFLEGQQETSKPWDTFSFVKFSSGVTPYNFVYKNAKIRDVPKLTEKSWVPVGGTALIESAVETIKDLGAFLSSLREEDRPSKVIFVIITDGEENSSKYTYTKQQLNNLITEHTGIWKWEFVFLAANQDAIKAAAEYGIPSFNSMSYGANELGTKSVFSSLTRSLNAYKSADVGVTFAASGAAFTTEERVASMGGVDPKFLGKVVTPPLPTSKNEIVKDDGHEVVV
jgi:hypothetical protein